MLKDPSQKYRPFAPVALPDRTWPDKVLDTAPIWASVDLRDGNQALIEPMDIARKQRMFDMLVAIGFKEIEVGFPSASQVEFDFVRQLIEQDRVPDDVTIQVLTQARGHLIERTFESLKGAKRAIVHVYNATSKVMREVVLGMNPDEIIELARASAVMLRDLAAKQPETHWTFEYSPEHWSGTELDFARRTIDAVTEVWQPTPTHKCIINLPSTVEYSTPNIFADMMEWTHRHIARRDSVVLSVHPHNDRGTGTAAGEFALMAGADRIEGCLFGNGERTGNVDLVNIALNLYTQGVHPGLELSNIDEIRRTAEYCTALPVPPRHPYAGDLVYTSFSGSHQDAIKKAFDARKPDQAWAIPYLPIDPQDVGRSYEAVIRVNSQSGKGGIAYLLQTEYGLEMPRRMQIEFSGVVQRVMDVEGKELTAGQLWQLLETEYGLAAKVPAWSLTEATDAGQPESVTLAAEVALQGKPVRVKGQGTGPIDALVQALCAATGRQVDVVDYHQHAIGKGSDARSISYVEVTVDGGPALFGVGTHTNTVTASLNAVLSAVRRVMATAQRKAA
ncbi:MAG: 2-isopropylmalate synthase [Burkholderiaceae bacterium]